MAYGRYKKYHPRTFRAHFPILWWVKKWAYVRFILRELTSLAVVFYAGSLLVFVNRVAEGPEAFATHMEWLQGPLSIALHSVALVFLLFHSYTWFNLAPKAMAVRIRGRKVPDSAILGGNYLMWAVVSAAIFWLITAA